MQISGVFGKIAGVFTGRNQVNKASTVKTEQVKVTKDGYEAGQSSNGSSSLIDPSRINTNKEEAPPEVAANKPAETVQETKADETKWADADTKPQRKDYDSDEAYDKSLCEWQTLNMEDLKEENPGAVTGGIVYYGSTLPPEVVFKQGIPEKGGDDFDLARHQREIDKDGNHNPSNSGLRGCCVDAQVPAKFAEEGNYVYKLRPLGGAVCLDTALFGFSQFDAVTKGNIMPGEAEICMGSRQPGYQIEGAYKVGKYYDLMDAHKLEDFKKNPDFAPQ